MRNAATARVPSSTTAGQVGLLRCGAASGGNGLARFVSWVGPSCTGSACPILLRVREQTGSLPGWALGQYGND